MQRICLVAAGAKARCSFGCKTGIVNKTPNTGGFNINGNKVLTQSECIPDVNIECFGECMVNPAQPKPCKPNGVWLYPCEMFEEDGDEVITTESCMVCACGGGIITFDVK